MKLMYEMNQFSIWILITALIVLTGSTPTVPLVNELGNENETNEITDENIQQLISEAANQFRSAVNKVITSRTAIDPSLLKTTRDAAQKVLFLILNLAVNLNETVIIVPSSIQEIIYSVSIKLQNDFNNNTEIVLDPLTHEHIIDILQNILTTLALDLSLNYVDLESIEKAISSAITQYKIEIEYIKLIGDDLIKQNVIDEIQKLLENTLSEIRNYLLPEYLQSIIITISDKLRNSIENDDDFIFNSTKNYIQSIKLQLENFNHEEISSRLILLNNSETDVLNIFNLLLSNLLEVIETLNPIAKGISDNLKNEISNLKVVLENISSDLAEKLNIDQSIIFPYLSELASIIPDDLSPLSSEEIINLITLLSATRLLYSANTIKIRISEDTFLQNYLENSLESIETAINDAHDIVNNIKDKFNDIEKEIKMLKYEIMDELDLFNANDCVTQIIPLVQELAATAIDNSASCLYDEIIYYQNAVKMAKTLSDEITDGLENDEVSFELIEDTAFRTAIIDIEIGLTIERFKLCEGLANANIVLYTAEIFAETAACSI